MSENLSNAQSLPALLCELGQIGCFRVSIFFPNAVYPTDLKRFLWWQHAKSHNSWKSPWVHPPRGPLPRGGASIQLLSSLAPCFLLSGRSHREHHLSTFQGIQGGSVRMEGAGEEEERKGLPTLPVPEMEWPLRWAQKGWVTSTSLGFSLTHYPGCSAPVSPSPNTKSKPAGGWATTDWPGGRSRTIPGNCIDGSDAWWECCLEQLPGPGRCFHPMCFSSEGAKHMATQLERGREGGSPTLPGPCTFSQYSKGTQKGQGFEILAATF